MYQRVPEVRVFDRYGHHRYRYPTLQYVRYDLNTGTRHFGKFGTASIPVPDNSVSSVRPQYRYPTLRYDRYGLDSGTRHFSNFSTTSIPVPDTSVSSVRPPKYTAGTGILYRTSNIPLEKYTKYTWYQSRFRDK